MGYPLLQLEYTAGGSNIGSNNGARTMDYKHLDRPDHVKEHIWRQHLEWIELGAKQIEENIKLRQKHAEYTHKNRAICR